MDEIFNQPLSEPGLQADQRLVDRGWLRIGAGAAVAGQAMVFSLAINLSEIEGWAYAVVHGILIASAVGALIFLGGDLVRSAWASLRERKISIDLLFLITLAGALTGSLMGTFTRAGSVYYEVVAILIVVHTTGKMLGARSRVAALRAVDDTREKFERCDVVQPNGSVERCKARELAAGSRVRVAPGGAIAVDGVIAAGRGYVQETSMTGEWRPEPRGPGDAVLAGTYSVDGSFEISVSGGARKLDAIIEAVGAARLAPSRLQHQADRLMAWFLPLVLAVCGGTFAWWLAHGPWERALFNAMAVLLVACPCAMGLATPIAVWGGLARLAKLGLIARTGDFLDVLSRVDLLCIDKTGTLSEEKLSIKTWRIEPGFAGREVWLRRAVAAVEQGLTHPIAEALQTALQLLPENEKGNAAPGVRERRIVAGQGVEAEVDFGAGAWIRVGIGEAGLCRALRQDDGPGGGCRSEDDLSSKLIHVFVDGERAATVELEERWREGLAETLVGLGRLGLEVEVLSGDARAGETLRGRKVSVHAGLTPGGKLTRIQEHVLAGRRVLFVGDGINDAAAMSAADGSVSMRGGADLARASSMAVYLGNDLQFLPRAVRLARAASQSIRTNLLFAAAYNLAGMALAAAGWLHPVAAALLMLGSSVFVTINSLRSGRTLTNAGQ